MDKERIYDLLMQIYGAETTSAISGRLEILLKKYTARMPAPRSIGLSERDAILITYPDQVQEPGQAPLITLAEFCEHCLTGLISGIHILPFYPWSSDDGFSVIDYRAVAPQYGDWSDIRQLGEHFRLMFDAVINHASAQSRWFEVFLQDAPQYRNYFIEVEGNPDLSAVVRPRTLPLLTEFSLASGIKRVWTTFSADQIDLNYHNPEVLLDILDVLLLYASQGAELIRLDAIAYLWKEIGTSCIHLPQTHKTIQLIRAGLDETAPQVQLITETNVAQSENLSYFGNGAREAQLVYNFPLPPLVLHAIQTGDASILSRWASSMSLPPEGCTFLNFLASHDGIGLNPLRGILPESEIEALAQHITARNGLVSYKSNSDGSESPYELNVNYFDALVEADSWETQDLKVDRFITAYAILLAFIGIPAVYFHSMFGSRGWLNGPAQTGRNRSINREKLQREGLECELADPNSLRAQVFRRLSRLLSVRAAQPCFSPYGTQRVLESSNRIFALLRMGPDTAKPVLCIHNVSAQTEETKLDLSDTSLALSSELRDIISGRRVKNRKSLSLLLAPYESVWLTN
jgi:glycosidase